MRNTRFLNLFPYAVFILNRGSLVSYTLLGSLLVVMLSLHSVRRGTLPIRRLDRSHYVILTLLALWTYGFVLGLAKGNPGSV